MGLINKGELPKNQHPTRILYEYENGDQYEITNKNLENYNDNLQIASVMHITHSGTFKSIKWKKIN